jgi:hypothetical protein
VPRDERPAVATPVQHWRPTFARPREAVLRQLILIIMIACAAGCASSGAVRRVDDNTVISRNDPAARFVIDRSLDYIGHTEAVVMNGRATAEQFWFGDIREGQLTRAVVVHFEHWNDDESVFDYPSFRLRRLGAHDYLHQSFPIPNCTLISTDVRALLAARNATAAQGCLTTRFVRATDETQHAEIILFYVEPGAVTEQPPEGFAPGGIPAPGAAETPWGAIDARLTAEALRLIRVEDD